MKNDNFNWQLGSGKSKSRQTGPSGDSSGKGNVLELVI